MYAVRYNNTRYHQQQDMIDWCSANIGPGGWEFNEPESSWTWLVRCMFGTTTFSFAQQEDLCKFRDNWDYNQEDAMTQLNATKVSM